MLLACDIFRLGSTVFIQGGDSNEHVEVSDDGRGGIAVVCRGQDLPQSFTGVALVHARLEGGDDSLSYRLDPHPSGDTSLVNLDVGLAGGTDELVAVLNGGAVSRGEPSPIAVEGTNRTWSIDTGADADTVSIEANDLFANHDWNIIQMLGDGADQATTRFKGIGYGGAISLNIDGEADNDTINCSYFETRFDAEHDVELYGNTGDDAIHVRYFDVNLGPNASFNLRTDGGDDDDVITNRFENVTVEASSEATPENSTTIVGGGGDDTIIDQRRGVRLHRSDTSLTDAGAGNDVVLQVDTTFDGIPTSEPSPLDPSTRPTRTTNVDAGAGSDFVFVRQQPAASLDPYLYLTNGDIWDYAFNLGEGDGDRLDFRVEGLSDVAVDVLNPSGEHATVDVEIMNADVDLATHFFSQIDYGQFPTPENYYTAVHIDVAATDGVMINSTGFDDMDLGLTGEVPVVQMGLLLPAIQKIPEATPKAELNVDVRNVTSLTASIVNFEQVDASLTSHVGTGEGQNNLLKAVLASRDFGGAERVVLNEVLIEFEIAPDGQNTTSVRAADIDELSLESSGADSTEFELTGADGTSALGLVVGAHTLGAELDENRIDVDVDTGNDGVLDSIWLDLDFPVQGSTANQAPTVDVNVDAGDTDSLVDVRLHGPPSTDGHDAVPARLGSTNVVVDAGDGCNEVFARFENVEFVEEHNVDLVGGRQYDRLQAAFVNVHSLGNFRHDLDGGGGGPNDRVFVYDNVVADAGVTYKAFRGGTTWEAPPSRPSSGENTIFALHRDVDLNVPVTADFGGGAGDDLVVQTFLGGGVHEDHFVKVDMLRGNDTVLHFERDVAATADNTLNFDTGVGEDDFVVAEGFETLDELALAGGRDVALVVARVRAAFDRLGLDPSYLDGPAADGHGIAARGDGHPPTKTLDVDLGDDDDTAFLGFRNEPADGQAVVNVNGGSGRDTIRYRGSGGQVRLQGGLEDDALLLAGFRGSEGHPGALLDGGPGNDILLGVGGNHILLGGPGDDNLEGGDGADSLVGGPGDDILRGGAGDDTLLGNGGADILLGEDGNDILFGGGGRDLLIGGHGLDILDGEAMQDIVIGGVSTHDDDDTGLLAILLEWNSANGYGERIQNIMGISNPTFATRLNADFFLTPSGPGATVVSDAVADTLVGSSGRDWFLADPLDDAIDALADELISPVV